MSAPGGTLARNDRMGVRVASTSLEIRHNEAIGGASIELARDLIYRNTAAAIPPLSFGLSGDGGSVKPCDQHIQRTIQLTQEMIRLADAGDADREDTGCGILYGVLRDAAYKLWRLAEEEKKRHQDKGWWPRESAESERAQVGPIRHEAQTSGAEKEKKS